jgi:ribonuclease HI
MKFYSVVKGRERGIFKTWEECQKQVTGFKGAKFKSFATLSQAQAWSALSSPLTEESSQIKEPSDQVTTVYTDGACSNNGKRNSLGGIGIWFGQNDKRNVSEALPPTEKHTNNRAELAAVLRALQIVADIPGKIEIYTDSQYTMKGLKSWMHSWKRNNWSKSDGKAILNLDLWKQLYEAYTPRKDVVDIVGSCNQEILQGTFGHFG